MEQQIEVSLNGKERILSEAEVVELNRKSLKSIYRSVVRATGAYVMTRYGYTGTAAQLDAPYVRKQVVGVLGRRDIKKSTSSVPKVKKEVTPRVSKNGPSTAEQVRMRIREDVKAGLTATQIEDKALDYANYAVSIGMASLGAAKSCIKANLPRVLAEQ